ncbi:GAF domain-containing protein [Bradyrhizobium elkanii]
MFDRKFYREIRHWFASLAKFRRYALLISTIVVPTVLGLLGAVGGLSTELKTFVVPAQICTICFGLLIGVGLFWFDENASLVFQKFAHETMHSASLQEELERQRTALTQLSAHINCLSVAARAVEAALLSPSVPEGLEATAKQLLESLADQRAQLFGTGDDEQWNFAIYRRNEAEELYCLHHRRNYGQPGDIPRTWPVGAGHVGLACQREGELLTDDASAQEVFQGKGELLRDYDRQRYRGIASICIPDVNDGRAIGVLVATSSKVGRYSLSNVQPLRDLAQSIGVILSPRQA